MKNYKVIVLLMLLPFVLLACGGASSPGVSQGEPGGGSTSVAGSTATMLPYEDVLYILDHSELKVVDLTLNPPEISYRKFLTLPETLFIYNQHLYVGGEAGVDILDISNPRQPSKVSSYQHIRSCDPVIVEDDIGYITLRSSARGRRCGGLSGVNRLEVVDMSDPRAPRYLSQFAMTNPYGLAKTSQHLAICQEQYGLSLLNVDDPEDISVEASFPAINCFDLIYYDRRLIATAADGIYQFAASDEFLTKLSVIPVGVNKPLAD